MYSPHMPIPHDMQDAQEDAIRTLVPTHFPNNLSPLGAASVTTSECEVAVDSTKIMSFSDAAALAWRIAAVVSCFVMLAIAATTALGDSHETCMCTVM